MQEFGDLGDRSEDNDLPFCLTSSTSFPDPSGNSDDADIILSPEESKSVN